MSGKMWFGTLERMGFVPAPLATSDFTNVGWTASETLLNGGGWARNSWTSHKEFGLNWGMQPREATQIIKDYSDGIMGEGPFYFVDPMAANTNLFPAWWAAPYMACLDAPPLMSMVPEKVLVPSVSVGLPVYGARYAPTRDNHTVSSPLVIPVPPDQTLMLGFYGSVVGDGSVTVTPIKTGGNFGTTVTVPILSGAGALTNTEFDGADCIAVRVRIYASVGSSITLFGATARLISSTVKPTPFYRNGILYVDWPEDGSGAVLRDTPDGVYPSTSVYPSASLFPAGDTTIVSVDVRTDSYGKWVGGRGNSGVQFVGAVVESPVGGRPEMSTIAAKFTETGGW